MGERYDFCGWATRNDLKCSDGRIIRRDAFKVNDGQIVPLVWNHQHNDPFNVLGHALLENREDGVYAYGSFNDTEMGLNAKKQVEHGDYTSLSIWANQLQQQGPNVVHGMIREVSLVLAGANPGAYIEALDVVHADGSEPEDIVLYTGEEFELMHADKEPIEEKKEMKEESKAPAVEEKAPAAEEKNDKTVKEVFDTLTEEQKTVVYAIIGQAIEDAKSDKEDSEGGKEMKHNVFDQEGEDMQNNVLSHSEIQEIFDDAKKGTLKDAVLAHTGDYGVEPVDYLFPDAKNYTQTPQFIKRETGWVADVMNGVHRTPWSRVKTMFADITEDDARAKGYIKGNRKKEEVFTLLKRTTTPTTIYKKQKMDRDDIVDITDFDVVAWIKSEMRGMLDEEIARAILVGDGRSSASDDKINESNIRPIWTDDDLFTIKSVVNTSGLATDSAKAKAFIKACIKARKNYKGSGRPVLFTTEDMLTDMLLIEDGIGHDLYDSEEKLATKLRVSKIVCVEVMEGLRRNVGSACHELAGIIVNLNDYNVGADKGGAINLFDDFDIDYNQYKYLIETRCSGALVKPFSAIAVELTTTATLEVAPIAGTETVLGKTVSSLQEGILMNDHSIEGTLKYVTGYTGYSSDPAEQSGNFLALEFEAPTGAVTTVNLMGSGHAPVTLDSDMQAVFRVDNKRQKIKVVMESATAGSVTKIYELNGLKLIEG